MEGYGWEKSKHSLHVFLALGEVGRMQVRKHRNNILARNLKEKRSQRLERDFPGLERGNMGRTESSEVLGQR